MIEYKNEINNFWDLKDLWWSGAISRLEEIEKLRLENEFMAYLEEMFDYGETPSLTEINDFIWFECDNWIEQHKNNNEEEEWKEIKQNETN